MDKFSVLKDTFGFSSFRAGQAEIIDALLARRDVLAVLPTGAGKSLCYQIPALLHEGIALVISPLISLMKDQVGALAESGVSAAYINSSLASDEYARTTRNAAQGVYKIIYVAPERLARDNVSWLGQIPVSMIVIDEAHCVSQWGHDFRPSYLQIAAFIRRFAVRPVIAAFTATATERVKTDIAAALELSAPFSMATGFDRPNLYFAVERHADKTAAVLAYLRRNRGKAGALDRCGIIYCATRKTVDELAGALTRAGFPAARYHAGLDDEERRQNQDDFIYDRKSVMAATNAFGMGIDKSNVSFVIHYNMPKNIESYYQEAGRAGRDGSAADCILYYSPQDVRTNEYLIKNTAEGENAPAPFIVEYNLDLLKNMVFYSTTTNCLRSRILQYFGGETGNYCGNCSNCKTKFESVDITIESQKIISCVYRLKQRGRRLGKVLVIQILRGSKSEKVLREQLDTLSTYGIMKGVTERRCRDIVDYLVLNGYLAVSGGEYPSLEATEKSEEIIFEKKPLSMMLAKEPLIDDTRRKPPAGPSASSADEESLPLFEKLRKLRAELARTGGVPAYVVFSDASLQAMCERLPCSEAAFLEIPGVGAVKAQKYGDDFIRLIQKAASATAEGGEGSA